MVKKHTPGPQGEWLDPYQARAYDNLMVSIQSFIQYMTANVANGHFFQAHINVNKKKLVEKKKEEAAAKQPLGVKNPLVPDYNGANKPEKKEKKKDGLGGMGLG